MNPNRPSRNKPRLSRALVIISLLLIIVLFSIEIYMNKVYDSNSKIKQFQDLFLDEITKGFMYIIFIVNHEFTMFFFIILVFNICNIYKSFMLTAIVSLTYYLSGLTKLLYLGKRPYFYNKPIGNDSNSNINVYSCELGWGFLSSNILTMVLYYFSLWKVFVESISSLQRWMKYFSLALVIIATGFFSFCFLLNGTNFFFQILSTYLIGIGIYLFIFEGLNINLNDGNQFYDLVMKRRLIFFVLLYFGLCGVYLIPFFLRKYSIGDAVQTCHGLIHSFFNHNSQMTVDDIIRQYQNESIVYLGFFLGSFLSIIAMKCELFFSFNRVVSNWLQFNFKSVNSYQEINDIESLVGSISITRDTKWNNTNSVKSFIRFVVLLIISIITIIPYLVMYNLWDLWEEKIYLVFFFKILLSSSLFLFCLFFLSKKLLIKMGLVNMTLMIIHEQS